MLCWVGVCGWQGFMGSSNEIFMLFFIPLTHFSLSPTGPPHFSLLSPTLLFLYSHLLSLSLKSNQSTPAPSLSGFQTSLGCADCCVWSLWSIQWKHWLQPGLFSISIPALSLSPLTARPCPLSLFVFRHGRLSRPQVSLIINDPEGGGASCGS